MHQPSPHCRSRAINTSSTDPCRGIGVKRKIRQNAALGRLWHLADYVGGNDLVIARDFGRAERGCHRRASATKSSISARIAPRSSGSLTRGFQRLVPQIGLRHTLWGNFFGREGAIVDEHLLLGRHVPPWYGGTMRRLFAGHYLLRVLLTSAVLSQACKSTSASQDALGTEATDGKGTTDAVAHSDAVSDEPVSIANDGSAEHGGNANDASLGDDGGAPDPKATQACRAAITALVERANFCFGYDIGYAQYLDACPDYYFNPDSNRSLAVVADCISKLNSQPCSELALNLTSACLPGGKRPVGAGCSFPSQCQGNVCQGGLTSCGKCQDGNFPPGTSCQRFQCQAGDFCDEAAGKCVTGGSLVYASEGDPCHNSKTSTVICQGDLHCTNVGQTAAMSCQSFRQLDCSTRQCDAGSYCSDSSTGTCVPFAKLGEACGVGGSIPVCDPSLRCWNGKCTKRALGGESCNADQPCSEFYDCVKGTCQLRVCPA